MQNSPGKETSSAVAPNTCSEFDTAVHTTPWSEVFYSINRPISNDIPLSNIYCYISEWDVCFLYVYVGEIKKGEGEGFLSDPKTLSPRSC